MTIGHYRVYTQRMGMAHLRSPASMSNLSIHHGNRQVIPSEQDWQFIYYCLWDYYLLLLG